MRPRLQRLELDTTGVKVVYALDKQDDTVRAHAGTENARGDIREVTQTREEALLDQCDEAILFRGGRVVSVR